MPATATAGHGRALSLQGARGLHWRLCATPPMPDVPACAVAQTGRWQVPSMTTVNASALASNSTAAGPGSRAVPIGTAPQGRPPAGQAWPGMLAACAAAILLAAFFSVVSRSAQDAHERHQAQALQAEAAWRCRMLRGASAREACLCGLQRGTPPDRAELQALLEVLRQTPPAEPPGAAAAPAPRPPERADVRHPRTVSAATPAATTPTGAPT